MNRLLRWIAAVPGRRTRGEDDCRDQPSCVSARRTSARATSTFRAVREQRCRRVGRMRGGAEVVREDRVLAVLALTRMAAVAAVQPARVLQAPIPAARRLQQVAAE